MPSRPDPFATCASPACTRALSEGSREFEVKARDEAGNESPIASFSWTVDLTPPAAPVVEGGPQNPSTARIASFTFQGDGDDGGSFHCRLDAGAYEPCVSPKTYSGLTDGDHSFTVKARDPPATSRIPPPRMPGRSPRRHPIRPPSRRRSTTPSPPRSTTRADSSTRARIGYRRVSSPVRSSRTASPSSGARSPPGAATGSRASS